MKENQLPSSDANLFSEMEEGHYFDRKSARKDPTEIARHIIAFTNAAGGKLIIGIEDNGEITGFKRNGAHDIELFEQLPITLCVPTPVVFAKRIKTRNSNGEDDIILVLEIEASSDHVVARSTDGMVFLRQGDKTVKLNYDQIRALEYDRNERIFEDELIRDSSINDIDQEEIQAYKKLLGTDITTEQLLKSRNFMRNNQLTIAGVVLFAKNPTQFLPSARVRILKIDGIKRETGSHLNIVKDITLEGPLPSVVREAKKTISHLLRDFYVLESDGRFKETPEYPEFAWFEGLINAVTHRDYALSGEHIRISIFEDRLEILSPGKLPNMITLDNMKTTRYSRNPRIARTLVDFGWVREFNEGIGRMYETMRDLSLNDPIYEEHERSSVLLTLENNIIKRKHYAREAPASRALSTTFVSLSLSEQAAVQYAIDNGSITRKELATLIGKTGRTATETLSKLTDKGILVWNGSGKTDPTGYYTIA